MRRNPVLPPPFNGLVLGGGLLLCGWWAWSYTGLYRFLAELQLSLMGSYGVQLTFLLTALATLVPLMFGARALLSVVGYAPTGRTAVHSPWTTLIEQHPRAFGIGGGGVVGVGIGLYFIVNASLFGPLVDVNLADLTRGDPPGRYVRLHGAIPDDEAIYDMEDGAAHVSYVPLVPDEMPRGPYVVVAKGEPHEGDDAIVGTLEENGLPGMVRTAYERGEALAPRYWMLRVGDRPEDWRGQGYVIAGLSAVVTALSGGYLWRKRP